MDALRRLAQCQQRALHGIHERAGAANEIVASAVAANQLTYLGIGKEALHRIEYVRDFQALGVGLGQFAQFVAENHRGFVAVGVDQLDRSATVVQR
ncbi:hypothetical protein D3C80_1266470 [compost metagenome]